MLDVAQLSEWKERVAEARGLALMDGKGMEMRAKDLAFVLLAQVVEELLAALATTSVVVSEAKV